MLTLKQLAVMGLAVIISATPALAGTKYATNLVSNDAADPPTPPDLSPKSSIKLDDKGHVAVGLAGVMDGGGVLVTSSGNYKETGSVDATTYVVILKLFIPGIVPLNGGAAEVPLPVELKSGKGKTKLSVGSLFAAIPGGLGRTVEIRGAEVWGPLGGSAGTCQTEVTTGFSLAANDPSCRSGSQIGMSGLAIPNP
jgi:hypothetical protein